MARKKLNIGLFGFGCVGNGLYEVLHKTPTMHATIHKICVKDRQKKRPISMEHFTFRPEDILDDPNINVVVELIDDSEAAFHIVSAALSRKKAVVSANKKMLAERFGELLDLQKKNKVPLLYEAATCASIPVIRNLEEYYNNDLLESIEGIVNGSTNYILTKTIAENLSYQQALQQAQALGFAESNPTLDTAGWDAKYKLIVLLLHAFGIVTLPQDIFHFGIERIGEPEIKYAKEKGLKIKLVAHAYRNEAGKIVAFVAPQFVNSHNRLFGVDEVFNGVVAKTAFADQQFFVGKGAGAYPTASAVLSDISALSYDYKYEYRKMQMPTTLEADENIVLPVYFRHQNKDTENIKRYFLTIDELFSTPKYAYTNGSITLQNLKKLMVQPLTEWSFLIRDEHV
jgi:homoserine dehydrogenase